MTHDDAWNHITAAYAVAGVAEEMLRRQDEEGLDVVLYLFIGWAAAQGRQLDAAALREAEALVHPWREEVIGPLRRLRRAMKTMGSDADADRRERVRARVHAAELAAERAQLDMLCDWLALH